MSDLPYSVDVLRLAAEAVGAGRLHEPDVSHTETNLICGDRTTVDLRIDGAGNISDFAHDTKACVIAQASASILGSVLPGRPIAELAMLRDAVADMLRGGAAPSGEFAVYRSLAGAASHPGRHRCVLLPIDAALKAAIKA